MNAATRQDDTRCRVRPRRWLRRACIGICVAALVLLVMTIVAPAFVLAKASVLEYAVCRWLATGASPVLAPLVIAHRGYMPDEAVCENSRRSIENALAAGYTAIEFDVNFTRDLVPVLFHDDTLERLTDGTGSLSSLDWSALQKIPLKDGQTILSLADFWQCYARQFELVCIDVKGSTDDPEARARALSTALPGCADGPRVIVIGVPYAILHETARLRPDFGYACEAFGAVANRLAGFDAVSAGYDKFSPGQARWRMRWA